MKKAVCLLLALLGTAALLAGCAQAVSVGVIGGADGPPVLYQRRSLFPARARNRLKTGRPVSGTGLHFSYLGEWTR